MRQALPLERRTPPPGPDTDAHTHEWVAEVVLEEADLAGALLHLGGVATVWEVLVNDTVVATGRSMFEARSVEVAAHLVAGVNQVVVRCLPLGPVLDEVPRRPRARWRTMLTAEPRLRWLRTSVLGRAPGFAPGPPVVGPWRPVVLETRAPVRVVELALRTSVGPDGAGVLDVSGEVVGASTVTVEVRGPSGSSVREVSVVDGRLQARLELPAVTLWWPHTHGVPALYDVRVLHAGTPLDLPGDGTLEHPDLRRVGFRTVVNDRPGSVALRVGGVPVFVRGAVWTPGDLAALEVAVELGLNLVRVTGIATYESDAFHARCDELGLLVWQDLMFATSDYPLADAGFRAVVEAEVVAQAARLVGHPSSVVVCGSAEHEQQATMAGTRPDSGAAGELAALLGPLVAASGLDATWVDSSPCGGVPAIRVDTGVAQYFGVGAYLRELGDVRSAGVLFAAECLAFSNLPDGPSTDQGVPRDHGASWDFADVRRHYRDARHGPEATLEQEQRVTGEVMAEVMGEWRRPASPCAGGIVLWLRDLEPGAGWGLLDHAGRTKPAARALAPTLQPTAVWVVDEGLNGLDVHVAHDGPGAQPVHLRVDLLRGDGSVVDSGEDSWELDPHGHRVVSVDALLGRWADASYAYRFGPAPHATVRAELTGGFGTRTATWHVPA